MFFSADQKLSTLLLEVFLQHRLCLYFILVFIIIRYFSMCCYSFLISGHRNCPLLSLQAEQSVAELTGAQNKLSAEGADLRVAAANMSSMNEALALDKVQLSKLVLQVSRAAKDLAKGSSPAAAASFQTSCLLII